MGKEKKKKKNKSDYGDNFIPPDGGFAWVICIASGLANLSVLPVYQQFGLLYRQKLLDIGLTHAAITSLVNINTAISSLSGFLNGPMFRRFSYRQVGIFGSLITTLSIFLTSLSNTFPTFLLSFGILLALGFGISMSANSLVFNVYFKEKRSKASSWTWTITGIGPVIFPYIITYLVEEYGTQGTILVVAAVSAHSLAFSMTYQPVLWHIKKSQNLVQEMELIHHNHETPKANENRFCEICNFSIQIDQNSDDSEDDSENYGNEIELEVTSQDPETPMMHTKQNVYMSNENLAMKYTRQLSKYSVSKQLERKFSLISFDISCENENTKSLHKICECKPKSIPEFQQESKSKVPIYIKFVHYFELDLLKNFSFLNIVIGLTFSFFAEINFSILTPFFLSDFGLENHQIAFLMSMPAIPDLACRFLIQFIVKKIKWNNRVFYLLGISGMMIARIVIALRPSYQIMCVAFFCLGIGKAFRTIFYGIIIPDLIPLKSLPAALGINRLFGGIFPLIFGSLVGIIRDISNYQVTIQFLNSLTMITIISWTVELLFVHRKNKVNLVMQ